MAYAVTHVRTPLKKKSLNEISTLTNGYNSPINIIEIILANCLYDGQSGNGQIFCQCFGSHDGVLYSTRHLIQSAKIHDCSNFSLTGFFNE